MKKVIEETVFVSEIGKTQLERVDFSDTFATTNTIDTMENITALIFSNFPVWVQFLLEIRDKIVKILGITTTYTKPFSTSSFSKTDASFFKTYYQSDQEIIVGANENHLSFRAIVYNTKAATYNINVTTLVMFHNTKGKIYMKCIAPFHRLVVMYMVKRAFKATKITS